MRTREEAIAHGVPESFWRFVNESCRVRPEGIRMVAADALPKPAKRLLAHTRDMTSTLAEFHGSALKVEILQRCQRDEYYLREVFLRTIAGDQIVEYGVIGIALGRFGPVQQQTILAGKYPLGEILHRFHIPFVSAPIGYFEIPSDAVTAPHFATSDATSCHGRFNRLATATGEPLASIMEILPPTKS